VPYLPAGVAVLAQPTAAKKSGGVTADMGLEYIITEIEKDKPCLDWFPEESGKPLQRSEGHWNELLKYLEFRGDCQVI